jgi:hypothetical protein
MIFVFFSTFLFYYSTVSWCTSCFSVRVGGCDDFHVVLMISLFILPYYFIILFDVWEKHGFTINQWFLCMITLLLTILFKLLLMY